MVYAKRQKQKQSFSQHRSAQGQLHLAKIRARAALVSTRTALVNAARGLVKSYGERAALREPEVALRTASCLATSQRNSGRRIWIGRADNDTDRGQAVGRHSSNRFCHRPSWRHVNRPGVGRVAVESVLNSWRNLRGDACRRPLVDPCHLREMPLTVLVDAEGRVC